MMYLREGIEEMEVVDLAAYQRKIAAGGEMKTAIKRFLDAHEERARTQEYFVRGSEWASYRRRIKELGKALEGWCNS